jgi:hypothetical protein
MSSSVECYVTSDHAVSFLRFETPRERLALPYATLLGFTLSNDETILELDFASHKITVKGKRLYEVFCVLSTSVGQALIARSETDSVLLGPSAKAPFIQEIRIKEIEPEGG